MIQETTINGVPVAKPPYRCRFPAPERVWCQTENGGWASREWRMVDAKGEKFDERKVYEAVVLGRT